MRLYVGKGIETEVLKRCLMIGVTLIEDERDHQTALRLLGRIDLCEALQDSERKGGCRDAE